MNDEGDNLDFTLDELRDETGDRADEDADTDRAFREASAVTDAEPLAALNTWLGRPLSGRRFQLQDVDVELAKATVKLRARDLDVRLKLTLAIFTVIAVSAQLCVADIFFLRAVLNEDLPSDTVLVAWLSSTVVEVIGIVGIVARNLFPDPARRRKGESQR